MSPDALAFWAREQVSGSCWCPPSTRAHETEPPSEPGLTHRDHGDSGVVAHGAGLATNRAHALGRTSEYSCGTK